MDAIAANPDESDLEAVIEVIESYEDECMNQDDIEHRMQNKGYSDAETLFLLIQSEGQGRIERKEVMHSTGKLESGIYYSINNS
ncbi:hypothetical protein HTZ84_04890 [Haloterrigena sp. SYSU A558-1]|uniref:Uncharacterized protein n=1 Tax=Haloterrigena gelatinilytica TaxID=2741724 RepID=A0ABX2L5W9_9EURY|nr:hypothetical protein [Haloterrigena gelatinilytica]NUC71652.1 hypothetical protein [Haloterrigena gelatinilytica]